MIELFDPIFLSCFEDIEDKGEVYNFFLHTNLLFSFADNRKAYEKSQKKMNCS